MRLDPQAPARVDRSAAWERVAEWLRAHRGRWFEVYTSESIKSLEAFDRAYCEEAQKLSQKSLDLLRPTIRKPGSELWFSWNPDMPTDPVDALLLSASPPPGCTVVTMNYLDNPWFPEELRKEKE